MFHRSLAWEISIALAFKVMALCALYFLFFGPDARPEMTADAVGRTLLSAPAPDQGG